MVGHTNNQDDSSSSYDTWERPSQRAWTHDDIYPSENAIDESDSSSDDSSSSSSSSHDDDSSSDDSESSTSSSSSSSDSSSDDGSEGSFAEEPIPKSNTSGRNYESGSKIDYSSDAENVPPIKPKVVLASAQEGVPRSKSTIEIEQALDASSHAISKAEEQRKQQLEVVEKSVVHFRAQEKKVLDISQHLDKEIENVANVIEASDDALQKIAAERASKKAFERHNTINPVVHLKKLQRDARIEKAKERIEREKEEQKREMESKKKRQTEKDKDNSEKARIERAYAWYTRMAMPSRERMKERIGLMSGTTGVSEEDIELLPWNARGTFVSVATMMKIQRTSLSSAGRKKSVSPVDSDSD